MLTGTDHEITWNISWNTLLSVVLNFMCTFSEGELAFTYAIRCRPSICLSYVWLSVTLVHRTQPVEIFGNVSTLFRTWPSADIHEKFYGDRPRGTSPSGALNARGQPNIAILDLSKAISGKRCTTGGKVLLVTNRKSYFDWYHNRWPWKTLNGVMTFILHYFTKFGSFRGALLKRLQMSSYRTSSRSLSHLLMSVLLL